MLWYATSPGVAPTDDVVAVFTRSVRDWRNPNVLPLPDGITLRTGANDMRIVSRATTHRRREGRTAGSRSTGAVTRQT